MAYRVELSTLAESELRAIFVAKNAHESQAAARWFNGLADALESLRTLPHRCPIAPEAADVDFDLRQLHYGKEPHIYRLIFQLDESAKWIWVVTIRHGARGPFSFDDLK